LFEDAVQRTWSKIVAWFARDRDASWFGAMLELPMAALRRDEIPTVVLQQWADLGSRIHAASRPADGVEAAAAPAWEANAWARGSGRALWAE
jgi:hypothetical protein